jgi:MFS family permease
MSLSESPAPTRAPELGARALGTLFVLCGALFLDALDVSMKGVALPSIRAELGMSTGALQWVMSAYVLGFGGFLLLGGRAADLLGRRRVFVVSLAVFLLASGVGGLATDGPMLVAARFVTGASAAFTAPAGLSIITTTFAEGPARNKALTIYTATGASGFSLGLVVGGLLTEVSWRWVFLAPVLMAVVTLFGALRLLPATPAPARTRGFDVPGALSVTAAMLVLVYALVRAPETGWGSWQTVGLLAAAAVLLAVFAIIEHRTAHPLVRLRVLRSGPLVRANIGAMALLGGWISTLFILTLYMQQVRGWSALETGLAVSPTGVVVAVFAPRVAAPLVDRFGVAPVVTIGLLAAAAAYALLLPLGLDSGYPAAMLPAFLLVGVAFTLAYGPLNIAATNGVEAHEQGVASGLLNTSFQIGPALVLAVVTAVTDASTGAGGSKADQLDGFHAALVVPVVVAVLGAGAAALGIRRRRAATR